MNCENEFCLYNKNNKCLKDKIEIDNLSCCKDCILIDLSNTDFNSYKEKQLKQHITNLKNNKLLKY